MGERELEIHRPQARCQEHSVCVECGVELRSNLKIQLQRVFLKRVFRESAENRTGNFVGDAAGETTRAGTGLAKKGRGFPFVLRESVPDTSLTLIFAKKIIVNSHQVPTKNDFAQGR